MTQRKRELAAPTATVAHRVQELRLRRGWSAATLADRCAEVGMPALNRSVIANLESGRRSYVTVDEAFTLAYVLDVAPIHLLVPVEADGQADLYKAAPERFLPIPVARQWIRGNHCPPGRDPRRYFSEVPRDEWEAQRPAAEEIEQRGAEVEGHRRIVDQLLPPKERSRGKR